MALSAGTTTTHIIDAMTLEAAPRSTNPLSNKVVHADIRVQGIDEEPKNDGAFSQSSSPLVENNPSANYQNKAAEVKAAEMQNWWAESIAKVMELPEGYSKVAVLLIKWADELDELRTGDEAKELDALFRHQFNYHTQTVELNVRKKPQHQLDNHISQFIYEHDGPHNLLIVYYTGHGIFQDEPAPGYLELTGSLDPSESKGLLKDARATWNKAEDKLRDDDVESDFLTILDTCYSSNLVKSGLDNHKNVELMSACAHDKTTAAPGNFSYTRALIDALKEFLEKDSDKPISTFSLNQAINRDPRRQNTPSMLWNRGKKSGQHNEQHILLTPLKADKVIDVLHPPRKPKGYLTLRFGLRDASLHQQQIEFMAETLSRAFKDKKMVGLKTIDWLDMKDAPPISHFERVASVLRVIKQWKRIVTRNKENMGSNGSQKRAHEGEIELPDAKKRHLEATQAPSPPVSHSSRTEYDA